MRAFCELNSVASTGGCATAQPIALTAITYIPTATAVLMTNRVMLLFRMIASIHECDCSRLSAAPPPRCDGHHNECEFGQLDCPFLCDKPVAFAPRSLTPQQGKRWGGEAPQTATNGAFASRRTAAGEAECP